MAWGIEQAAHFIYHWRIRARANLNGLKQDHWSSETDDFIRSNKNKTRERKRLTLLRFESLENDQCIDLKRKTREIIEQLSTTISVSEVCVLVRDNYREETRRKKIVDSWSIVFGQYHLRTFVISKNECDERFFFSSSRIRKISWER